MKVLGTAVLTAALFTATPAMAGTIEVLAIDTTSTWDYSTASGLTGVNVTEVSVAGFGSANLSNYDVLWISETFLNGSVTVAAQGTLNALNSRAGDIQSFLAAGGGVLALAQPIGTGRWDWLPDAIEPTEGTNINDDTVTIVAPGHPVMQGLTNAGLSGWGTSSHGNFLTDGGLTTLVTDGGSRSITLAGMFGLGRVVLTDQDPDFHNFFGNRKTDQIRFVQNSIDWLATPAVPLPPAAWMGLAMLAGVGLIGRRRKSIG